MMWIINERPDGTRYKNKPGDMFDARDRFVKVELEASDALARGAELKLHRACGQIGLYEFT